MSSGRALSSLVLLVAAAATSTILLVERDGSSAGSAGRGAAIASRAPSNHFPREAAAISPSRVATQSKSLGAVARLSQRKLAGQRIVYAFAGLRPPASLLSIIRAGEAGGVIFFGPNISSLGQIRSVIDELQRASMASPVHAPLLMLTDQEGGEVRRLPGAPTLSEKQIGEASQALARARSAGLGAGENLRAVGMNVNLAPVLDVYRQPGNFIDEYQRSYSSNPETVAGLGGAFVTAQQRTGVAATAKHFPGLGSATRSQNTDLAPVTLRSSLATLRSVDERPYRNAFAAGVKLIMTSWATYTSLDRGRPAGLSSAVIQGELRRRLGFRGVTITDGIDAGAITRFGNLGRRAVLAAAAGADLILCAATNPNLNTPALGTSALDALTSALAHHRLSQAAAQQAAGRILALRSSS
jgi:beta-N-acetylhexosaminidase